MIPGDNRTKTEAVPIVEKCHRHGKRKEPLLERVCRGSGDCRVGGLWVEWFGLDRVVITTTSTFCWCFFNYVSPSSSMDLKWIFTVLKKNLYQFTKAICSKHCNSWNEGHTPFMSHVLFFLNPVLRWLGFCVRRRVQRPTMWSTVATANTTSVKWWDIFT